MPEIEVTPEMVEAGQRCFDYRDGQTWQECLAEAYCAMRALDPEREAALELAQKACELRDLLLEIAPAPTALASQSPPPISALPE